MTKKTKEKAEVKEAEVKEAEVKEAEEVMEPAAEEPAAEEPAAEEPAAEEPAAEEPAAEEPAKASQEAKDAADADESDSQDALRLNKVGNLSLDEHELTAHEEQRVRSVVELHYRAKGLRFRGASLTQAKLDELLADGAFLGRLGYLRQHVKPKRK